MLHADLGQVKPSPINLMISTDENDGDEEADEGIFASRACS